MALQTLPECVLAHVAAFGGRDGFRVVGACRLLAEVRESCARAVAHAMYSEQLAIIDAEEGYASFVDLLRDDNARHGIWCLDVDARIEWTGNDANGSYYVNRVSRVGRVRGGALIVVLEAYGESDLRDARSSCVFAVGVEREYATSIIGGSSSRGPVACAKSATFVNERVRTPGHRFCVLAFQPLVWDQGPAIGYQFNGRLAGDYPANLRVVSFDTETTGRLRAETLARDRTAMWRRRWADAFRQGPLPEGAIRRVFVPLGTWFSASNTTEIPWYVPDVAPTSPEEWGLPAPILARWRAGTWGM